MQNDKIIDIKEKNMYNDVTLCNFVLGNYIDIMFRSDDL